MVKALWMKSVIVTAVFAATLLLPPPTVIAPASTSGDGLDDDVDGMVRQLGLSDGEFLDTLDTLDEELLGHSADRVYTLVDADGRLVTRTALDIGVGDSYIDEENRLWEVIAVDGDTARVEFREVVPMPAVSRRDAYERTNWVARLMGAVFRGDGAAPSQEATVQAGAGGEAAPQGGDAKTIGIYFSHNAESYVPTSGTEFKEGRGDIHAVGRALKEALEEQGITVYLSENLHLPHDGGAYRRSRNTVRELLQRRPVTLLDIHRDAIPADEYRTVVNGERMTKVRLVVGRQNPNREANLEYAKQIKAIADEEFPGLIKGIFHARGNYNQDFGPRMLLLEMGTHETSREEAERSARLMAQVIPRAAGVEGRDQVGMGGWRGALWLALLAVAGALAYLRINAGSWEAFFQRLRELVRWDALAGRRLK